MSREWILGVLLAVAAGLVIYGVALLSAAAGFVVGGVLVALWSWLLFGEVDSE